MNNETEKLNWSEIESTYPLAWTALGNWAIKEFDLDGPNIEWEVGATIEGLKYYPRDLYDFFDSHDILVMPEGDHIAWDYKILNGDVVVSHTSFLTHGVCYYTRKQAELAAFAESFKLLNTRLETQTTK